MTKAGAFERQDRQTAMAGVLIAVCFVLMATSRGTTETFAVFLLPLSNAFQWERAEANSIYGIFMLAFGVGSILAGRLIDRIGPGRTFGFGLFMLSLAFTLGSSLNALWQFHLCIGVIAGVGAAAIGQVPHAALLSRWFTSNLTIAIATVSAAAGLGVLIVAPLTQVLIEDHGWRSAYLYLAAGTALLVLVLLPLPWRRIATGRGEDSAKGRGRGRRVSTPIANVLSFRAASRTRAFRALFAVQFLTAVGMFSINPQIVAYLIEQGFDPLVSAGAFGLAGLAGVGGLLLFAITADKVGRMLALTLSYSMTMIGMSLLFLVGLHPTLLLLHVAIFVYGPTFGSRGPIMNALIARQFGRGPDLGTIMGTINFGMGMGAATGATVGGLLLDLTGGYGPVLAFGIAVEATAISICWMVPEIRRT